MCNMHVLELMGRWVYIYLWQKQNHVQNYLKKKNHLQHSPRKFQDDRTSHNWYILDGNRIHHSYHQLSSAMNNQLNIQFQLENIIYFFNSSPFFFSYNWCTVPCSSKDWKNTLSDSSIFYKKKWAGISSR